MKILPDRGFVVPDLDTHCMIVGVGGPVLNLAAIAIKAAAVRRSLH